MTDIVHRLRTSIVLLDAEREEAAAEIERLRDQVTRLSTLVDTERSLHDAEIDRLRRVAAAKDDAMKTQAAEIERLREERDSAFQTWKEMHVATLDGFIEQHHEPLKAEIDRLRSALEDCQNLDEAPDLRAEIERLREVNITLQIESQDAAHEIERLRMEIPHD